MSDLERLDEALENAGCWMAADYGDQHNDPDCDACVIDRAAKTYRNLVNGERVEWCEEHRALEAAEEDPGFCWRYDGDKPCRIGDRLLIDPPTEEE